MFLKEPLDRELFDASLTRLLAGQAAMPVAVVWPCDRTSLEGAVLAAEQGLIVPTLVGPAETIGRIACEHGFELGGIEIRHADTPQQAAIVAAGLARQGQVQALMKGSLHTNDLMRAIVARESGLRTGRRMSHVFAIDHPQYHKLLLITDAALNMTPGLDAKRDIIQNAVDMARRMGVALPKVAVLAAVETVEEDVESTLHAAALCKMAERGQISGAVLEGPLALDNALSSEAARIKGIVSVVAGDADILAVPNYEAGNMLAKDMEHMGGALTGGIVLGATVPVILTSRSDTARARIASCLLARILVAAGGQ